MANAYVIAIVGDSQVAAESLKDRQLTSLGAVAGNPAILDCDGWRVFIFTTWPGAEASLPSIIDAVIVDLNPADPAEFKAYFKRFDYVVHKLAPRQGYDEIPPLAIALNILASSHHLDEFLPGLLKFNAELTQLISQEFATFDRDSSGFIDLQALKDISGQLGQELSDEELQTALSELDANKVGKISLEEFTLWWKSGRKGANKTMRKLTRGVAKVKNLLNHAHGEILKLTEVDEPLFTEVNLFIGNESITAPTFGFSVEVLNSENEPRRQADLRVDSPNYYVQIGVKSPNPAQAAQALKEVYDTTTAEFALGEPEVAMALSFINFSSSFDEERAYLTVSCPFAETFAGEFLKLRPMFLPEYPQHLKFSFLSEVDFTTSNPLEQAFYTRSNLSFSAKIADRLQRYQESVTESKLTKSGSGDEDYHPSETFVVGLLSLFKGLDFKFAYAKANPAALPLPTMLKRAIGELSELINSFKLQVSMIPPAAAFLEVLKANVDSSELSVVAVADVLTLSAKIYGKSIGSFLG
jgi:hypothetical protein